jgi:hypothetical protein
MLAPDCQPITFSFGLLGAPIEAVGDELSRWYEQQSVAHGLLPVSGSLPDLLHRLEPLSAPSFKRLWVRTTSSPWPTAYFDGFVNGGDPFPPVSYLATRLGTRGVVVTSRPSSKHCHGGNKLELYGPRQTAWLNLVWCVAAVDDGGRWVWKHFGDMQPFEEAPAYASRRVKDRFTPDMLRRYCSALMIPLEASAYGPEALLDLPAGVEKTQRLETLDEARARYGLEWRQAARQATSYDSGAD